MDTMLVLSITACLLSAGMVYFFMEYRAHGDRDKTTSEVLSVQAQLAANIKKLKGYTRYMDYLAAGHHATAEHVKFLTAKVVREYVHVETMPKEKCRDAAVIHVVFKYSIEYSVGMDLKPEHFEVLATSTGIDVRTARPGLIGAPVVKPVSHEVLGLGALRDEFGAVKEIHDKFAGLALHYGAAVALEDSTRALCKLKVMEFLRDFLVAQPGVTNVPVISVAFK